MCIIKNRIFSNRPCAYYMYLFQNSYWCILVHWGSVIVYLKVNMRTWYWCHIANGLLYFLDAPVQFWQFAPCCDWTPRSNCDRSWIMPTSKMDSLLFWTPWFSLALLCQKRTPLFFCGRFPVFLLARIKSKLPNLIKPHKAPFLYDKNIYPHSLMGIVLQHARTDKV